MEPVGDREIAANELLCGVLSDEYETVLEPPITKPLVPALVSVQSTVASAPLRVKVVPLTTTTPSDSAASSLCPPDVTIAPSAPEAVLPLRNAVLVP